MRNLKALDFKCYIIEDIQNKIRKL